MNLDGEDVFENKGGLAFTNYKTYSGLHVISVEYNDAHCSYSL